MLQCGEIPRHTRVMVLPQDAAEGVVLNYMWVGQELLLQFSLLADALDSLTHCCCCCCCYCCSSVPDQKYQVLIGDCEATTEECQEQTTTDERTKLLLVRLLHTDC